MSPSRISLLLITMGTLYACAGPLGGPIGEDGAPETQDDKTTAGSTTGGSAGSTGAGSSSHTSGAGSSSGSTGAGVSSSSSAGISSSSGGGVCDGSGDCDTCAECAQQGECAGALDDCFNDPDCDGLLQCLSTCVDDQCAGQCFSQYPGAEATFTALDDCIVCQVCPIDCDGQGCI